MAEAKHTEIAQNLLIKVQPRKVKKKKQTQNPTQTKLIWIYIFQIKQKRTGIGSFIHHSKSFEALAVCLQKHMWAEHKSVH